MSGLVEICNWLSKTSPSIAIQNAEWAVPTLQSIHILSIGIVLTSLGMLDLQLAGLFYRSRPDIGASARFLPWIWGGLAVLLISGSILILGEPVRELTNTTFWLKMGLLAVAVTITLVLRRIVGDDGVRTLPPSRRRLIQAMALVSLAIWFAVLVCGRGIAYTADA